MICIKDIVGMILFNFDIDRHRVSAFSHVSPVVLILKLDLALSYMFSSLSQFVH